MDGSLQLPRIALDVLGDLERAESQLLCWGMVDGSFSREELTDILQDHLIAALRRDEDVPYGSADDLIEILVEHALLFELPAPRADQFRTRTAEIIRLFVRLKQIFPGHMAGDTWRAAPNLVSDYRLILRAREYPKRHIAPEDVEARLAAASNLGKWDREVLRALLGADTATPFNLADFQVEATERLLASLTTPQRAAGTIVCAGTGSGKTLAFYLPALLELGRLASAEPWTRCLALYPRNELLKDQLSGALEQVRNLNRVLASQGRAQVSVGALYGDVPSSVRDHRTLERKWSQVGAGQARGWACPYLSCPEPACEHARLVWLDAERKANVETLHCSNPRCNFSLDESEFVLTRRSMTQRPPDLLFTGLEMVNQSMSSVPTRRLLGVGVRQDRTPRLVLLDEVHTYSSAYGAQAALLLRRWKQASRATPHFVGLSATLEDATRFFGDLVGEPQSRIVEISPRQRDLEPEGREVLLALRGDPVSKTSLLSTSIQSAILLRRALDPNGTMHSLFGTKLFAFTDDLDVTNRLYHNLLDAEGWKVQWGGVEPSGNPPLAHLRQKTHAAHAARFEAGQSWDLVEAVGHELERHPSVRVGRTSSQDAGVDRESDIIIATAALEVGFDDPLVGAVLQHKAPRDAASFLQRKGRAGRPRGTHPWTVVVLSDYGRDRLAYQGYEQLFSPQLRPRYLPIGNRHVLRIQAVLTLMDWLATQMEKRFGDSQARLWPVLSQPPKDDKYRRAAEQRLDHVVTLVTELLDGAETLQHFSRYLGYALKISTEQVEQLLWDPPRSLMLSVLPTIVRRLTRRWKAASANGKDTRQEPNAFWSPLPEFLPAALFSDLNLPDVVISLPPHGEEDVEFMPILQGMREFAPGRASRRFGIKRQYLAHWIPVTGPTCAVEELCGEDGFDELAVVRMHSPVGIQEFTCLRPRRFGVQQLPRDVGVTSNGRLRWASQLLPRVEPVAVGLPSGSAWAELVRSVQFFTHGYGNAIEVRRFALGSRYDIRLAGGESQTGDARFTRGLGDGRESIALGYAMDADALCLEIELPRNLFRQVCEHDDVLRGTRVARLVHEVMSNARLDGVANEFERGWLVQIYLSALLLEATEKACSLEQAAGALIQANDVAAFERVLRVIFRSEDLDDAADPDDRRAQLLALLHTDVVRESLREGAASLWVLPDASWEEWLHGRLLSTLGAAVLEACQQLCPEVDADDLCLDIEPGPRGPQEGCEPARYTEIWLSETSPGGSGVVEAVSTAYASDPRRFFNLVEAALAPSDFEEIDVELTTLLGWLAPDSVDGRPKIVDAANRLRNARSHAATIDADERLRALLETAGLGTTHPVLVAMQARILRPGSSRATDHVLYDMLLNWAAMEQRLGVEVDARLVAYTMSAETRLDEALEQLGSIPSGSDRRAWRYGILYGLLWPRGVSVRSQMLSAYNPFVALPETDRLLVLAIVPLATTEVRLECEDWHSHLCGMLVDDGAAILSAPPERKKQLRDAIQRLLVEPLDTTALLVQPVLAGVTLENRRLRARFEVREGLQ